MRLARFDTGKTGLVIGDAQAYIVDILACVDLLKAHDAAATAAIAAVLPAGSWADWGLMIRDWNDVRGAFEAFKAFAEAREPEAISARPLDTVVLDAPMASRSPHIFGLAGNTAAHAVKALKMMHGMDVTQDEVRSWKGRGLPPSGFTVWPSTMAGSGAVVAPPPGTHRFDYEGECVAYLKTGGRSLSGVEIWGYAAFNDLSVRDANLKLTLEAPHSSFSLNTAKNFDTGNTCGPWVVVGEVANIENLRCVTKVNGEIRQDWTLAEMMFNFEETFIGLSRGLTLRPGDMVASGTGAGVAIEGGVDGTGYLKPGDVVEIILDNAGILKNTVGGWQSPSA